MTAGRTDTAAGSSAAACPRPPALTAPDLSRLRDGEADELTAGEMVEDLELVEADLSGGDLSALTLLSCRFSEVFANDTDLAAARLVDCRLERLSATYLHSPRSTWRTVELVDSRIGAWELSTTPMSSRSSLRTAAWASRTSPEPLCATSSSGAPGSTSWT